MNPEYPPASRLLRVSAASLAVSCLVFASCSPTDTPSRTAGPAGPAADSASMSSPVPGTAKLTNCGAEVEYQVPATRIVSTSNSTNTGSLLRIGAADHLAAAQLSSGNDDVLTALFGPGIKDLPRLQSPISLEAVIAQDPDLLIGSFSGLFSGSTGVTIEAANDKGIATYVISDSCRQDPAAGGGSQLGTMDPWDAVRTDLRNFGVLTGHETEAADAVEELDTRLAELAAAARPSQAPRVLLFDSGTKDLYTSGRNGSPQGILNAAGADNIFDTEDTTWFRASWEAVAAAEPDAIIVMDYRSDDPDEIATKLETLRSQASLKNLAAIKENRIIVLPLTLFMSGFANIEAAEQVRSGLEDLGLLPATEIEGKLPASFAQTP